VIQQQQHKYDCFITELTLLLHHVVWDIPVSRNYGQEAAVQEADAYFSASVACGSTDKKKFIAQRKYTMQHPNKKLMHPVDVRTNSTEHGAS
jgi:hypothetical protein